MKKIIFDTMIGDCQLAFTVDDSGSIVEVSPPWLRCWTKCVVTNIDNLSPGMFVEYMSSVDGDGVFYSKISSVTTMQNGTQEIGASKLTEALIEAARILFNAPVDAAKAGYYSRELIYQAACRDALKILENAENSHAQG